VAYHFIDKINIQPKKIGLYKGEIVIDSWTEDELRAAVIAYFDMHNKIRSGEKIVKKIIIEI